MTSYLQKLKQTLLDQRTMMSQELLSALDKELFVSSDKEVLVDKILNGTNPFSKYLCRIGSDVYSDVEFFRSFNDMNPSTIFENVSFSSTKGGAEIAKHILSNPIYDTYTLEKRKEILQRLDPLVNETLQTEFAKLASLEKDVFWAFDDIDQNLKELYDMAIFRFCLFKPLNRYPTALTSFNIYRILVSPLVGILSPIIYFIVPYLILAFRFKMRVPFKVYMKILFETLMNSDSILLGGGGGNYKTMRIMSYAFSMIFYFQGIFNSIEIAKTLHRVTKHLVEKTNQLVSFIQTAHKVNNMLWNNDIALYFIETSNLVTKDKEDYYINQLQTMDYSFRNNFGKQIHTYITLDKPILKSILTKVYSLDALCGFLSYKQRTQVNYPTFVEHSLKPVLEVKGLIHPCIDIQKVVPNDIEVDKNIIITGPNAGGKSTFIKSMIIHVLLNQTITISNAKETRTTPFYDINSQINIPDCKGYESLFEAEMYRCKHKLDLLKSISTTEVPKKWALFVMDEIFNSTNPVEGIAGAYAIAKKISEHPHCILIFTTHYAYLTKLKHTKRFTNYRMNIIKNDDGVMHYPYKLEKGVSKQYVALELLKKNGFDEDLIQEALEVKGKLTKTRV